MVGRFYVILIFLLTKALLPLRSEKARPLPLKKKLQLSQRHPQAVSKYGIGFYMFLRHRRGALMRSEIDRPPKLKIILTLNECMIRPKVYTLTC